MSSWLLVTTPAARQASVQSSERGNRAILRWPTFDSCTRPDNEHPADWKSTYGRVRRWAHMLGFGGHFATKSRRYSTARQALKQARRQWRRARHYARRAQHHSAHTDEETTLIVGNLTFAGIGYRTSGDQWLALTAAAQAREQRQISKEERSVA